MTENNYSKPMLNGRPVEIERKYLIEQPDTQWLQSLPNCEKVDIIQIYLKVDEKELLTIWLADKVLDTVEGEEDVSHDALVYAQKEMKAEV